jgi:uncharacterized protein
MKALNGIALVLIIVGGINRGLVGLLDFNLVSAIFGTDTWLTNLVYILVGIAAIYAFVLLKPVTSDRAMSNVSWTTRRIRGKAEGGARGAPVGQPPFT